MTAAPGVEQGAGTEATQAPALFGAQPAAPLSEDELARIRATLAGSAGGVLGGVPPVTATPPTSSGVTSFDAYRASRPHRPTTPFELGGETFHVRPRLPAGALLELGATQSGQVDPIVALVEFLDAALVDGDGERFRAMLRATPEVDLEVLTQLLGWVVRVTTGRPTSPLTSSPGGSSSGGPSGAGASLPSTP